MSISQKEKDRSHKELMQWMRREGVDIVIVFGDTGDWGLRYGNLRYLTDCKVIFGNSVLIFPLEREPILFMSSALQANWARKLSWISDSRPSTNFVSDVVNTLK